MGLSGNSPGCTGNMPKWEHAEVGPCRSGNRPRWERAPNASKRKLPERNRLERQRSRGELGKGEASRGGTVQRVPNALQVREAPSAEASEKDANFRKGRKRPNHGPWRSRGTEKGPVGARARRRMCGARQRVRGARRPRRRRLRPTASARGTARGRTERRTVSASEYSILP